MKAELKKNLPFSLRVSTYNCNSDETVLIGSDFDPVKLYEVTHEDNLNTGEDCVEETGMLISQYGILYIVKIFRTEMESGKGYVYPETFDWQAVLLPDVEAKSLSLWVIEPV